MKVITFTSLFPNSIFPNSGVFVSQRMATWATKYSKTWTVVAPVPYFPRLPFSTPWSVYAEIPKVERIESYKVYHPRYLTLPKVAMKFQGLSMSYFSQKILQKLLKFKDFDLIDSHFTYPDGYAASLLGKYFNLPFVVTARGSDINTYPSFPRIKDKIQIVLRSAKAVVGVSQDLVDRLIELGAAPDRCHLIPNGVNINEFRLGYAAKQKPLPKILAVGNLVKEKSFNLLLRAIKLLENEYPNLHLSLAGQGPERAQLEDLCCQLSLQGRVSFLGIIPHNNISRLFRKSGMFCLTSIREGCPNVILEALASGLPVASTPVGGVPELIKNGENGFLANDFSPKEIAHAINRVLRREWDPTEIRDTIKCRSWEKVADEIEMVFNKAISRK